MRRISWASPGEGGSWDPVAVVLGRTAPVNELRPHRAHLESKQASTERERFEARFRLARRLYESGLGGEDIRRLYRFLEWILRLPAGLEMELKTKIEAEIEGRKPMPYLATFERIAMEKGRNEGLAQGREQGLEQGLREALRLIIRTRFGVEGQALLPAVESVRDAERLRSILEASGRIVRIEELAALLVSA